VSPEVGARFTSRCETGAIRWRKTKPGSAITVAHTAKNVGYPSRSTRNPDGSPEPQRPRAKS
jgi:hypothetical protein